MLFIGAAVGMFCRRFVGAGGSVYKCVWLEVDGPVVEEFKFLSWLQRAVTFGVAHRWRR
jgi:hypothetical protein